MKRITVLSALVAIFSILMVGCADSKFTTWLTFLPEVPTAVAAEDLKLAQRVLQERLDLVLPGEATARIEDNHLRVGLVNERNSPLTIKLATNVGRFVFFHSDGPMISGEPVPSDAWTIITDTQIETAAVKLDATGRWVVSFKFTPDGKDKIATYSKSHVGAWLIIAQDNTVFFSTMVQPGIEEGTVSISKNWDEDTAKVLAAQLKSGRLPFQLVSAE